VDPWTSRRQVKYNDWYDVMQVCENGHIISSMTIEHPDSMKKRCPDCGKPTLTKFQSCNADIPGYHHKVRVASFGPTEVPAHCHNCGNAFPWTKIGNESIVANVLTAPPQTSGVFIVHGHDEEMKQHVARVINMLGLSPIILHEQPNSGKTIIEKFEKNADVLFAVVLLSPDDMGFAASGNPEMAKPRARQNVVLELGYFVGKLGRSRVIALKRGDGMELPSDISGVAYTCYDPAGHWKFELVRELKTAGYTVDANKIV
jgi:predicted nucleotide-binding protein